MSFQLSIALYGLGGLLAVGLFSQLSGKGKAMAPANFDGCGQRSNSPTISLREYSRKAGRTSPDSHPQDYQQRARLMNLDPKVLHGAIGIGSESGEILDTIKAHIFYGKELDRENLIEEAGDVLWFLNELSAGLGVTLDEIAEANIEKLQRRYHSGGFSEAQASERADKCESVVDRFEAPELQRREQ